MCSNKSIGAEMNKTIPEGAKYVPFDISGRTPDMHARVCKVLQHHKLTVHGDGVIEADLIEAVLASIEARKQFFKEARSGTSEISWILRSSKS
jgi:hypothetical protein